MGDALADSFVSDIGCDASTASRLAVLARARVAQISDGQDDSDEDLVHRLRDPRIFGEFAAALLDDRGLPRAARESLADHAFDLLPLPRAEEDIIVVEGRAPRHLLSIARFLASTGGLTVLHVMHLVFAVFLDRNLLLREQPRVRSSVLASVAAVSEASGPLRAFYAAMHFSAVPVTEAAREFHRLIAKSGDEFVRKILSEAAVANDGGVETLLRIAREEGLVPGTWTDPDAPEVVANIPRLPVELAPIARRSRSED